MMSTCLIVFAILLSVFSPWALAQQSYDTTRLTEDCTVHHPENAGYVCESATPSCDTVAYFRVPSGNYVTLDTISTICFNTSSSAIASASGISSNASVRIGQGLYIPLTCTCYGNHSSQNVSYTLVPGDTFYLVTNHTYKGLTTCQAVQDANPTVVITDLQIGQVLTLPIRCACPSEAQKSRGIARLVTYPVADGDDIESVVDLFAAAGVTQQEFLTANSISNSSAPLFAATTVLIPIFGNPPNPTSPSPTSPTPTSPTPTSPTPMSPASAPLKGIVAVSVSSSPLKRIVAISVSLSLIFTLLVVSALFYWARLSKRIILEDELGLHKREEQDLDTISFKRFSLKELHDATSGFTSRKLGAGGFGVVFEGQLLGRTVAVKRLKNDASEDFRAEVEAMGTVNHVNMVRLVGFCAEESHRLLVYEYMCSGSLDTWIFNPGNPLPWDIRLQIAKGTADCLAYLHEQCRDCILHLDIKPQNVLLDASFCAKISDFGLSKLSSRDAAIAAPMRVRGTHGYIAPELFAGCVATPKADVYSFGIVLWELVSGRRVLEPQISSTFHPEQAFCNVTSGKWDEVIDSTIYKEVKYDERRLLQVKNTMRLAYWCIQYDQHKRPSMSNIVQQLHSKEEVPDPPLSQTFTPNWTDFLASVDAASIIQAISLSHAR